MFNDNTYYWIANTIIFFLSREILKAKWKIIIKYKGSRTLQCLQAKFFSAFFFFFFKLGKPTSHMIVYYFSLPQQNYFWIYKAFATILFREIYHSFANHSNFAENYNAENDHTRLHFSFSLVLFLDIRIYCRCLILKWLYTICFFLSMK